MRYELFDILDGDGLQKPATIIAEISIPDFLELRPVETAFWIVNKTDRDIPLVTIMPDVFFRNSEGLIIGASGPIEPPPEPPKS